MIFFVIWCFLSTEKARDDLIALLLYGFSNLRYFKHTISDVLVYKRCFSNFRHHFNKFRGHVELGWANQILLKLFPVIGTS